MKKNAALVVAFLCTFFYFMPWGLVVSDPFYVHVVSIAASVLIVAIASLLSRALWSTVIQILESVCVIFQSKIILNWDNQSDIFYMVHDKFMLLVFAVELLFLATQTPIYGTIKDAISNTFRRAFLAIMRVYPAQRNGYHSHNNKGAH